VLHFPPADLIQAVAPTKGVAGVLVTLGTAAGSIFLAYLAAKHLDLPLQAWLRRRPPRPAPVECGTRINVEGEGIR